MLDDNGSNTGLFFRKKMLAISSTSFDVNVVNGFGSPGAMRDMTEAERAKADSKTSPLHCFTTRAVKIDYKGRTE